MRRRERKKKNTLLEILSLTALLANVWVRHTSCQYICRFVCGEELVNSFSAQSQTTAGQTSAATVEFNVPIRTFSLRPSNCSISDRQPLCLQPNLFLGTSRNTHKKKKTTKKKQVAYGLTDGLEDTVNEAGADLAGITGGTQAVNLTAKR